MAPAGTYTYGLVVGLCAALVRVPYMMGAEPLLVRMSGRSVTGRHGTVWRPRSMLSLRITTELIIHASHLGVHTSL